MKTDDPNPEGRPVVFLDIDGVVNTQANYDEWSRAKDLEFEARRLADPNLPSDERWPSSPVEDAHIELLFDRLLMRRLDGLCRQTDARVVVSSSWRMFYHGARFSCLVDILRRAGLTVEVLGPTPCAEPDRWAAIQEWIGRSRATWRHVILDDTGPRRRMPGIVGHLVRTDPTHGLTEGDVETAKTILLTGVGP